MRRTLVRLRRFWREYKLLTLMLSLLILLGAVFWFGYRLTHRQSEDVWAVIPPDAILIAEIPDLGKSWSALRQSALWSGLQRIPYFQQATKTATDWKDFQPDSLEQLPGFLLQKPRAFASWHLTSPKEAAWLFYLPLRSDGQKKQLQDAIRTYLERQNLSLSERFFNGRTVYEVRQPGKSELRFGFLWEENVWVGSYEPLLLDQVVRHTEAFEGTPLQPPKRKNTAPLQTDTHLKLHLPWQNAESMTRTLFGSALPTPRHLAESLELSFTLSGDRLLATGMAGFRKEGANSNFFNFLSQQPLPNPELYRFVPWQTALLLRQSWNQEEEAVAAWQGFRQQHQPEAIQACQSWEDDYSFDTEAFQETLSGELALAVLEKEARRKPPRLLLLPLRDAEKAEQLLLQFAQNTLPPGKKTPLLQKYERWSIHKLNMPNFPEHLLGKGFGGFEETHFVFLKSENMLLLANTPQTLKSLYDDLVAERTWGQQVRERKFWEQLEKDASLSLIINFPRLWLWFNEHLEPAWKPLFSEYPQAWLQTHFAAFQLVPTSQKLAAGVLVEFAPARKNALSKPQKELQSEPGGSENLVQQTAFVEKLKTKPYLVQNHIDRSWEALVQDESDALHLVSQDGKILWTRELGDGIVPESVQQIDFYDNGKLQYVFATSQKVYVMDRLGRILKGFPIVLPKQTRMQSLSVIDYDNSKNYRFLAADQNGRLYLYDKSGRGLERWQPRSLAMRLAAPVEHIRAGTKDGFLTIQRDGTVNFLKRNSRPYNPFPIRFETPMSNPYLLFAGSDFEKSEVVTITDIGELIRFNLKGEILQRESLPRQDEMRFSMILDKVRGDIWLTLRLEPKGFTVFDAQGEEQFSVATDNVKAAQFQFYRFRTGRSWLVWHDPEKEVLTIFRTEDGSRMLSIPGSQEIALLYSETRQELELFRCLGKRLEKLRIEEF